MPKIRVTCPTCATPLELDAEFAGQDVECGSCHQVFAAKAPKRGRDDDARPAKKKSKFRRDDDDDDDDDDDRPRRRRGRSGNTGNNANGLATTSLVLGLVSCVMAFCCGFFSLPLGIAGLVCGFMSMKGDSKGLATGGVILSGISLVIAVGLVIFGVAANFGNVGGFGPKNNNNAPWNNNPAPQPWNGGQPPRNFR